MKSIENNSLTVEIFEATRHVFPIKNRGKTPLTKNGYKDASNDPKVISHWAKQYPECNWGIATGSISGVFVLDVDVNHLQGKYGDESLAELEKLYSKLPDTPTVLTGGGGKHYYFKMPQGVEIPCSAGKLGTNLDIRSNGGYVVAAESIHENGRTYEWESEFDPYEDGIEFADAPQWLIDIIKRDTRASLVTNPTTGFITQASEWDGMGDMQRADFIDALTYCENHVRDQWVKVGMCIHMINGTQDGFNMWFDWSRSQNYPKFDPQDTARVWASFHKDKESSVNKETVFFIARKKGWVSSAEKVKREESESLGAKTIYEMENKIVHDPDDAPKDAAIDFEFPNDTRLLQQLRGIIKASTSCYSEMATTQAVIALASLIASRRYVTPSGDSTQLYVGVSTPTLEDNYGILRYTSRAISEILQECFLEKMICESRISSTQKLLNVLYHSPATLYMVDDYTCMIGLAKRQTTGSMEVVLNTISKIYERDYIQIDSLLDAGLTKNDIVDGDDDGKLKIKMPCLSMFALFNYSSLPTFTKLSETSRGSVNQFLFAICDKDDITHKAEEEKIHVSEEIVNRLLEIRGLDFRPAVNYSFSFADICNGRRGISPKVKKISFSADIEQYDKLIDEALENCKSNKNNLKRSSRKNLRRLISVLTAFNNTGDCVASEQIMKWCANYIVGHLKRFVTALEVVASDDGKLDIGQQVESVILNHGAEGITESGLVRYCRPYRALNKDKRLEILALLKEDGFIEPKVKIKQNSGQFKERIVHSSFLSK